MAKLAKSALGSIGAALGPIGALVGIGTALSGARSARRQAGAAEAAARGAEQLSQEQWDLIRDYLSRIVEPGQEAFLALQSQMMPLQEALLGAVGLTPAREGSLARALQQMFAAPQVPFTPEMFTYTPGAWYTDYVRQLVSPTTPFDIYGGTSLAQLLTNVPTSAQYRLGGTSFQDILGRTYDTQNLANQMLQAQFNPYTAAFGGRRLGNVLANVTKPTREFYQLLTKTISPTVAAKHEGQIEKALMTRPQISRELRQALGRTPTAQEVEAAYKQYSDLLEQVKPMLLGTPDAEAKSRDYYKALMEAYTQDIGEQFAKAAEAYRGAMGRRGLEGSSIGASGLANLAIRQAQEGAKAKAQAMAGAEQMRQSIAQESRLGAELASQLQQQKQAMAGDVFNTLLQQLQTQRSGLLTQHDLERQATLDYINQLLQQRQIDIDTYNRLREQLQERKTGALTAYDLQRQAYEDLVKNALAWSELGQQYGRTMQDVLKDVYGLQTGEWQRQLQNMLTGYGLGVEDWQRQTQAMSDLLQQIEGARERGIQGYQTLMGTEQALLEDAYKKLLDWYGLQQEAQKTGQQNWMTLLNMLQGERQFLGGLGMPASIFGTFAANAPQTMAQLAGIYSNLGQQSLGNFYQAMQNIGTALGNLIASMQQKAPAQQQPLASTMLKPFSWGNWAQPLFQYSLGGNQPAGYFSSQFKPLSFGW